MVGLEASPLVVSGSPHLVETQMSLPFHRHALQFRSVVDELFGLARGHFVMVFKSPCRSMLKPATGLPVSAMPLTTCSVQVGSMPMTTSGYVGVAPEC